MSKLETDPHNEAGENREDVLSRLIVEQGVTLIDDLDRLADLWPADDDPDALMNHVLLERQPVRPTINSCFSRMTSITST
jgi:hypothetical protein